MIQWYREFMGGLGKRYLMDTIPLDIIAHFLVGIVIYRLALKLKVSDKIALSLIVALTFMKELLDSAVIGYDFSESIVDIFFSLIYPVAAFFLGRIRLKQKQQQLILKEQALRKKQDDMSSHDPNFS